MKNLDIVEVTFQESYPYNEYIYESLMNEQETAKHGMMKSLLSSKMKSLVLLKNLMLSGLLMKKEYWLHIMDGLDLRI